MKKILKLIAPLLLIGCVTQQPKVDGLKENNNTEIKNVQEVKNVTEVKAKEEAEKAEIKVKEEADKAEIKAKEEADKAEIKAKEEADKAEIAKKVADADRKKKIKNKFKEVIPFLNKASQDKAYPILIDIASLCNQNNLKLKECSNAFYNKALIEESKGEYLNSVTSYQKSVDFSLDGEDMKIFEKMANIYYLKLSDISKALDILTKKVYSKKEHDSLLNYRIGALYIEKGEYSNSKKYILEAKKLGNRDAEKLWYKHDIYKY